MTGKQQSDIVNLVNDSLDKAEGVWNKVGDFVKASSTLANESILNSSRSVETQIPGHQFLEDEKPLVDEFIALALDMRDSSKHLNMAIKDTDASDLERVYYETAAILPACSRIITNNAGGVKEYLGD